MRIFLSAFPDILAKIRNLINILLDICSPNILLLFHVLDWFPFLRKYIVQLSDYCSKCLSHDSTWWTNDFLVKNSKCEESKKLKVRPSSLPSKSSPNFILLFSWLLRQRFIEEIVDCNFHKIWSKYELPLPASQLPLSSNKKTLFNRKLIGKLRTIAINFHWNTFLFLNNRNWTKILLLNK